MKRAIFPILPDMLLCIHVQPIKQISSVKSVINNTSPAIPLNAMEFLRRIMPLSE